MSDQGSNEQSSEDAYQPQQANKQVLIRMSDMEPQDQCAIVSITNSALEEVADMTGVSQTQKFSKMAGIIKRELDGKQGEGWYIICGKNFGTYVTHEQGAFIHFSFDDIHICIFRAQ